MKDKRSNETKHMIEETKEYYRERATQYSDWSHPTNDWEQTDSEPDESWFAEAQVVIRALEDKSLGGNVLEVASGTGEWTETLIRSAASVTALDASPEMHKRSKSRLGANPKVRYVVADFYDWTPDTAFDAVTFSFWLSHVPGSMLSEFVSKLVRCLKPEGEVFFVDQRREAMKYEALDRPDGEIATRSLMDGREFKIIKHFYSPEEIKESFLKGGIKIEVSNTPTHFLYADGRKIAGSQERHEI